MRKSERFFLIQFQVQQTGHRRALAYVGSGRFSGIGFVCLGLCVLLWCKESVYLPVVNAQEFVCSCGHVDVVRLSLGALFIHEGVNRVVLR